MLKLRKGGCENMDYKKIERATKEGRLIDYDKLFASYPKKRQEEIKRRSRYLMAAMELRKLRRKMKMSQGKLARKVDIKREFISRLESGSQNITLETLYRIAEATGKEFKFSFK